MRGLPSLPPAVLACPELSLTEPLACLPAVPVAQADKPFIFLSLTLPPEDVDVNVHPTKKEARGGGGEGLRSAAPYLHDHASTCLYFPLSCFARRVSPFFRSRSSIKRPSSRAFRWAGRGGEGGHRTVQRPP